MLLSFLFLYIFSGFIFSANFSKKNKLIFSLILSPIILSFLSLILLFFGIFNFWVILFFAFLFSIYGIFKIKRFEFSFKNFISPLIILVLIFAFFLIQGEPFEGACDAGVYISSALHLIDKGTYFYKFDELLPTDLKEISIVETNYQYNWKETYPGIIFLKGKFVPQFFPLYSIHLGIFYKIFKIKGLLFCNFWFFFLTLLVFYKLINLFLDKFFSFLSLLIFSLNPGLIYFIKYPTAEIFLAFLILSFLYFFIIYNKKSSFAFFSTSFFSLSLLTKFLSYFLFFPLFLFYLKKKRKFDKFLLFLFCFIIFPLSYILKFNYPYFLNHLFPILRLKYAFFIIFSGLIYYIFRGKKYFNSFLKLLPFFFFLLSLWALLIRTNINEILEENNLLEFTFYFGFLSFSISLLGVLFSSYKKNFIFLNLNYYLFLILIIFGTSDNPLHPFSFRRYIPLFLPLTSFYFSYFLKILNFRKYFSIMILIFSIFYPLYKGKNLILSKEGKGFLNLYSQAENYDFPKNTLCTEETYFLSSQLNLISLKNLYPLNLKNPKNLEKFQNIIKKNKEFYLFSGDKYPYEKVFEINGVLEKIQNERNKIPEKILKVNLNFFLYKIFLNEINPYEIEIGKNDFGRVSNLWDLEFDGERYFKWTKRQAYFYIKLKNEFLILLDKGGNLKKQVPFRIYLNDRILFEGFAKSGWNEYRFKVPADLNEKEVVLRFVTHSFTPLPDTRELGLKLSGIFGK